MSRLLCLKFIRATESIQLVLSQAAVEDAPGETGSQVYGVNSVWSRAILRPAEPHDLFKQPMALQNKSSVRCLHPARKIDAFVLSSENGKADVKPVSYIWSSPSGAIRIYP
jgi:hypothetical protein